MRCTPDRPHDMRLALILWWALVALCNATDLEREHETAPPAGVAPALHAAMRDYAVWHARATRDLMDHLPRLERYAASANWTHPDPPVAADATFPPTLLACVCQSGLSDSLKAAVDLFLTALLTRRLFFLVCPATSRLQVVGL